MTTLIDTLWSRPDNDERMPTVRRFASVAVMTALMLSLAAQCLVAQDMTASQMACCAGTAHDCEGAGALEADCCQSERAQQAQVVEYAQQVVMPLTLTTAATTALLRQPDVAATIHPVTAPLAAPSPPKYVLLAAFLI